MWQDLLIVCKSGNNFSCIYTRVYVCTFLFAVVVVVVVAVTDFA